MFTADEAFEAAETGEPIMIDWTFARDICADHGVDIADMVEDIGDKAEYDAAVILGWLGY